MKRIASLVLILSACVSSYAADLPPVIIGADDYDAAMCVEREKNNCINSICLNSEEIDCIENCKSGAIDKCKEASE